MRIGNSPYMRKISQPFETLIPGCEKYAGNEDLYFACSVRSAVITFNHQVGTARMGHPKDPRSVVDPQLRYMIRICTFKSLDNNTRDSVTFEIF